jgi:D-alanine transaminase
MAKHAAHKAGDYEALMIDQDGYVTEAGSSSFFFIKNNELLIRPVTNEILHGITRQTMLRVAQQMDLKFVERFYKLAEVLQADEALITASSIYVLPVSKIDDHVIADGRGGRFTVALRKAYLETARAEFYQPTDS